MVEYSLLDKIIAVYNLVMGSPLFLILITGIILMIVDITYISSKDPKTKKIYLVISLVIIALFVYSYFESVSTIFDSMARNIVEMIYFPTMLQYVSTLIASLVILSISIFHKKINKIVKRVNISVFILNSFLFLLILDQFGRVENIDINNKVSIYVNSDLMILLELSLILFAAWMIGLVLYKIIKTLIPKEDSFVKEKVNLITESAKEIILPKKKEDIFSDINIEEIKEEAQEEMFSLEEYKEMKALLEIIKKNKK